ncbi:MAG: insulinase family protein [Hormoscilla sp. SP12CHS1]|nr:insulinase family protein [Hormoscilla sp. SP12CHS1]
MLLAWGTPPTTTIARLPSGLGLQNSTAPAAYRIGQDLERIEKQVREFTLDNGLKFIVRERHQAPIISFITYVNVGGVDEPVGKTGVAHYLEHLAFKGTTRIGTKYYAAEKPLLIKLDRLFDRIKSVQTAGDGAKLAEIQEEFERVRWQASSYVKQNEFGQIIDRAGGVGLNATTSADATRYFFSLPSNKLELWMSLESERFGDPVFREFFTEKEVILEERRLRTDNSALGKIIEAFQDSAFQEHPYGRPIIGYEEDIRNLTRQDVEEFFATYYVPRNLTVAIVGDMELAEVKRLAQIYFGSYQDKPLPEDQIPEEPPQTEAKEVTVEFPSQPWYLEGYHRPAMNHPDHVVYEMIGSILSDGRTSRLYKSLVEKQQVALGAAGESGFPGNKYPNLMLFYAVTAPGHTVEEVAAALQTEITGLKTEPVSQTELDRVKTQARASRLRAIGSNAGLASLLVEYEAKTGAWRNMFREIDLIAKVTAADIQ